MEIKPRDHDYTGGVSGGGVSGAVFLFGTVLALGAGRSFFLLTVTVSADDIKENKTLAGSPACCPFTIETDKRFAHSSSCSIAAALKVSEAAIIILCSFFNRFDNLAIVVVFPTPFTPTINKIFFSFNFNFFCINFDIRISLKRFFASVGSLILFFSIVSLNFNIISLVVSTPASAFINVFSKLAKNSSLIAEVLNKAESENLFFEPVNETLLLLFFLIKILKLLMLNSLKIINLRKKIIDVHLFIKN